MRDVRKISLLTKVQTSHLLSRSSPTVHLLNCLSPMHSLDCLQLFASIHVMLLCYSSHNWKYSDCKIFLELVRCSIVTAPFPALHHYLLSSWCWPLCSEIQSSSTAHFLARLFSVLRHRKIKLDWVVVFCKAVSVAILWKHRRSFTRFSSRIDSWAG